MEDGRQGRVGGEAETACPKHGAAESEVATHTVTAAGLTWRRGGPTTAAGRMAPRMAPVSNLSHPRTSWRGAHRGRGPHNTTNSHWRQRVTPANDLAGSAKHADNSRLKLTLEFGRAFKRSRAGLGRAQFSLQ